MCSVMMDCAVPPLFFLDIYKETSSDGLGYVMYGIDRREGC